MEGWITEDGLPLNYDDATFCAIEQIEVTSTPVRHQITAPLAYLFPGPGTFPWSSAFFDAARVAVSMTAISCLTRSWQ
jgi:hypothetical protein